jgi:hypothetical protein
MSLDAPSLFALQGERFVPTRRSGGPWSASALHGGPPAALLGRAVERFDGGEGFFVARVTVELLKPVPFAPLTVTTRLVRPGRKVQLVEAALASEGTEVARALGLRIRRADVPLPGSLPADPVSIPPGPEGGKPHPGVSGPWHPGFHTHGVEHRFVRGAMDESGPATDWIRLAVPLLEGEDPSPLVRTCAAADFGNGVSGILRDSHTYVNPDLTVSLHRYPEGEWICLDAVTRVSPLGIGVAESQLHDMRGPVGRAVQCLIIDARPG